MKIEYKAVGVTGATAVDTEGLVRAFVSVTGLRDNVNDIIKPGAYAKSLAVRTPKGVWHHNWHESVSRTETIKELLPGDPELPATLPNGQPWPKEAGALRVDTRFNLKTQRGREAYEDVLFFGDQQEWSIGYNVPTGGAVVDSKTGIRSIETLDLYEYSPVLFGAMPNARTATVKEAQNTLQEVKRLHGDEANKFLIEMKSILGDDAFTEAKGDDHDEDDEPMDDRDEFDSDGQPLDDEDDFDEDIDTDHKSIFGLDLSGVQRSKIENAIKALQALLDTKSDEPYEPMDEFPDSTVDDLSSLIEEGGVKSNVVLELADDFVEYISIGNQEKAAGAATTLLDSIEEAMEWSEDSAPLAKAAELIGLSFKDFGTIEEKGDEEPTIESKSLGQPQEMVRVNMAEFLAGLD